MSEPILIGVGAVLAALVAALIAKSVKISEFRQAWIDNLREDISLYISKAHEWIDLYIKFNKEEDNSKKGELSSQLDRLKYDSLHILTRIKLRFKADDKSGNELIQQLLDLLDSKKLEPGRQYSSWKESSDKVETTSRKLLKKEWEVTKNHFKSMLRCSKE